MGLVKNKSVSTEEELRFKSLNKARKSQSHVQTQAVDFQTISSSSFLYSHRMSHKGKQATSSLLQVRKMSNCPKIVRGLSTTRNAPCSVTAWLLLCGKGTFRVTWLSPVRVLRLCCWPTSRTHLRILLTSSIHPPQLTGKTTSTYSLHICVGRLYISNSNPAAAPAIPENASVWVRCLVV